MVPMVCRSHASRGSAHLSTLPCLLTPLGQAWYALPLPLPLTLALAPNPNQAWYALSSGASSRGVFAGAPGFAVPIRKCPLDHFLEPASLHPVAAYPPPPRRGAHQSAHPDPNSRAQLPSPALGPSLSPSLGPTSPRATPSASSPSSTTRAPPRSRPPPPARRSSPTRARLARSRASSPATRRPRCSHIGLL